MSPRQMGSLRRAVSLFFTILSACWGGVAAQLQGCYKANRNDFSTSGGMTVNYDVATYTGTQITNILDVNLASGLHCRCTCHAGLALSMPWRKGSNPLGSLVGRLSPKLPVFF